MSSTQRNPRTKVLISGWRVRFMKWTRILEVIELIREESLLNLEIQGAAIMDLQERIAAIEKAEGREVVQ